MSRRSRRKKPFNLLGAFLVEAGATLVIVALAQPTWTRSLIEQIRPASQAAVNSATANSVVSAAESLPVARSGQLVAREQELPRQGVSGWHQPAMSTTQGNVSSPAMQPITDTSERFALAGWSASSMPDNQYSATQQYSQYSLDPYAGRQYYSARPHASSVIRPVYPPVVSTSAMPAWSNSY